jgi:hypothetical protein
VDEFIQVQTIEANDLPSKRNLIFWSNLPVPCILFYEALPL